MDELSNKMDILCNRITNLENLELQNKMDLLLHKLDNLSNNLESTRNESLFLKIKRDLQKFFGL